MNLTALFQYGNQNIPSRNAETVSGKGNGQITNTNLAKQALKDLTSSQTTQGALGPLYENMAQDENVLKALEAAKLPTTDEWVRLVLTMMKQGMSIDKNALLDMGKLMSANTGANPETLVMLKALNLPVTPENIQQFENYERYEHQILQQVSDVVLEFPRTFQSMVSAGQTSGAIDFYTQVLQLFTGTQLPEGAMVADMAQISAGNRVFADIVEEGLAGENAKAQDGTEMVLQGTHQVQGKEGVQALQAQVQAGMSEELMQLADGEKGVAEAMQAAKNTSELQAQNAGDHENLLYIMDTESRNQLASMLGRLGFSQGMLTQIREGGLKPEQVMKSLEQMLAGKEEAVSRTDLMQLFGSKEYNQILEQVITKQWLLKPEDVADKKGVEEFYSRLNAQTSQLLESLEQIAKDTPLAKNLMTMQNNLDFMNQMNQMFQYIQLPLKMSDGNAHGDLYVYANRRNTPSEDGSVSALLHLDMEHLGTMDVHVRMKDTQVSTKFYLQDEAVVDFIAEHIHILNERLNKRGYTMQAQMVVSDKTQETATNVIETITAQEKKATLLAQYSFDVRA